MRLALLAVLLLAVPAHAAERSSKVRRQFQAAHPCPANGSTKGNCPGYVADHIMPVCAGGPDTVENLQWQTVAQGKAKDRVERALCAALKREAKLKEGCKRGS